MLSRKKNEVVVINDIISVMVVEVRGDKVRLGFDAPDDIRIHRKEVWMSIQKEGAK